MLHSTEEVAILKIASRYGWTIEITKQKIKQTQEMLRLAQPIEAIEFLLETTTQPKIICDGCNVRPLFEHRCHKQRSVVQGEQTNKMCRCTDCFVTYTLGQ